MKTNRYALFFPTLALASIILFPASSKADVFYDFTLDTSPLIGHPAGSFLLGFQLNDGSSAGDANNSVFLSDFQFGLGSATGTPLVFGGATGDTSSGITLTDSDFFNAFLQEFNPGSQLKFRIQATTNVDAGGTPDEFSFFILDSSLTSLPTLGFVDAFLIMDLDSTSPTPLAFGSDPSRAPGAGGDGIAMSAPNLVATPEPATFGLVGMGLFSMCLLRLRVRR